MVASGQEDRHLAGKQPIIQTLYHATISASNHSPSSRQAPL